MSAKEKPFYFFQLETTHRFGNRQKLQSDLVFEITLMPLTRINKYVPQQTVPAICCSTEFTRYLYESKKNYFYLAYLDKYKANRSNKYVFLEALQAEAELEKESISFMMKTMVPEYAFIIRRFS